jgi:hypothetical protein
MWCFSQNGRSLSRSSPEESVCGCFDMEAG